MLLTSILAGLTATQLTDLLEWLALYGYKANAANVRYWRRQNGLSR
jgi:hypothetical protein